MVVVAEYVSAKARAAYWLEQLQSIIGDTVVGLEWESKERSVTVCILMPFFLRSTRLAVTALSNSSCTVQ